MDIQIRKWESSDFDGIQKLFCQVHNLHQSNRPDFYRDTTNPISREDYGQIAADDNSIALLAEKNGEIVGFCHVTLRQPPDNPLLCPRKVAYMEDLCIDENYRNQGIAKLLFDSVKREIKKRDYHILELMVWDFNINAIDFYKHMGMTNRSIIMEMDL